MEPFVYQAQSQRVVFGSGTIAAVCEEVNRLGCSRVLVLSTPQQEESAATVARGLGKLRVGTFAKAAMHTPNEVTERALRLVAQLKADSIVSLGGGSTTGLGKAIALRTELPQIVVPTTYAGSEATPILGETQDGRKTTMRSASVLPEVIVYDVELTMSLPIALSVTSGLNAIAHAVEARYARERNPVISLLALEGTRALASALPLIVANPRDRDARSDALYGAWACGTCLGAVGMALHHKICHVLGGTFNLPHAETHAVVLPYVLALNAPAVPELDRRMAEAFGADSALAGLLALRDETGAPRSLRSLGLDENQLREAVRPILDASPEHNPMPVTAENIEALLRAAWAGKEPG